MVGTFKFVWKIGESVLRVLIGGNSLLDSKQGFSGSFRNLQDTEAYLLSYGFDLSDSIETAELKGTVQEATRFVKTYFLKPANPDGLGLEIPKKIAECQDARELLLISSGDPSSVLRLWACAIIKVMHTLSHVDRDMRSPYFTEVQKQIFDRFYRYLHRDEAGVLYLARTADDPLRVNLVEFQVKPKKGRDSMLMKLLHKPESVAEEVFDRVGIRFITQSRFDAVRVVHFLEQARVIVAANIKPSRSRNTLFDLDQLEQVLANVNEQFEKGAMSADECVARLEQIEPPAQKPADNRFTSAFYRSIQFTCRHLIKLHSPLADQIRDLKFQVKQSALGGAVQPELQAAIDRLDPKLAQRTVRFFYPYEIQVMDHESFVESEKGRSAHVEYKNSQRQAALFRVMGALAKSPVQVPNA